jgi:NAD(P)H-hydrate epimerase
VLVVGGDRGMGGAVAMAAEAALRVGAGLVSVATRSEHVAALIARRPEVMVKGVDAADEIDALLGRATVVALGPGLGRDAWGHALFDRVMAVDKPCVVDADGLHRLAANPPAKRSAALVVTPHVAEAAALLQRSVGDVQRDRFETAAALVERYAGAAPFAAVLKGAGSIVASPAKPLGVCLHGNPGMASAGMGDVLAGVVAGVIAQGVDASDATRAGVCLHSYAADRAAARDGQRGLLATDLLPELRTILNEPF